MIPHSLRKTMGDQVEGCTQVFALGLIITNEVRSEIWFFLRR